MKVREGEYAYEIESVKDPSTMLFKHYKVSIHHVRMEGDQKVFEGTAPSFEDAKAMAEDQLHKFFPEDQQFREAG